MGAGGRRKVTMREYQSGTDGAGNATFGPGLVFEGKLSFQGQVRFDGTFTGEITTDDLLIIGETAKVSADITCGSVVINGEVNGKIKARDSVELRGHARVKADLATPSLVMDKGVVFEGYCNMMDKRDIVALPTTEERRKSWQSRTNGKHQDRRNHDTEIQPADFSAQ
jgi:cytoskeletal protein CcmA (bactofilin family)